MTTDSLLSEFLERFRSIYTVLDDALYASTLESFSSPKPLTFWVNPLKSEIGFSDRVLSEKLQVECLRVAGFPWTYKVHNEHRKAVVHSDLFAQGRIYAQNLSSMLAAIELNPAPGDRLLDLAAAPGGKAILMASLMNNRGSIAAVEAVTKRYHKLKKQLAQYGVTIAKTFLGDGRFVGRKTPGQFDRVLLDAPCSSEARFRINDPETWQHWSENKIKESARKQKGLIISAYKCLKPGGTLIYCTCSFAPEENEAVIQHLIKTVGENFVEIKKIDYDRSVTTTQYPQLRGLMCVSGLIRWRSKTFHPDLVNACRILPSTSSDGLFLCKLKKVNPQSS